MSARREVLSPRPNPSILVVGSKDEADRITTVLAGTGFVVLHAQDGATALRVLPTRVVDLVLADASLADMDGSDLAQSIKHASATRGVAVILMLEHDDARARELGRAAGADDVIVKPVERGMVVALIAARLEAQRLHRQVNELEEVVVSLSRALDDRNTATGGHSERIAHWATQIGAAVGLAETELTALYKAALLHDLGMVAVPYPIVSKPGPLEPSELSQVMQHAEAGERLLRPIPEADRVLPAVRHHHEKVDGSGYPDGLRGDQIPLLARIVALADAFVALTSDRPYRRRLSREAAIEILRQGKGRQWDAALVDRFVQVLNEVATISTGLESAG